MSFTAILLILFSACTHAGWNLLTKRTSPTAAFFLAANIAGMCCLAPVLVYYPMMVFPPSIWGMLVATGLCQAIYYTSLANAYRIGDLSAIYPLVRSSPALVVTATIFLLGRGDEISAQCIYGTVLVVAGCFLLPMRRFRDFRIDNYLNLSSLFALMAALGTTGYSMIDDEALRQLRTDNPAVARWQIALVYAFWEAVVSNAWLTVFALPWTSCRCDFSALLRTRKAVVLLAGIGIYFTYVLVLISLAFVDNVSYAVGFRQISIPLGAVLGVLYLKEPAHRPKFIGIGVLVAGLMLIATG